MKGHRHFGRFLLAGLLSACGPLLSLAQEKPLSLSGELTTGFYSSEDGNPLRGDLSAVPLGVTMNARGFVGHPDFLLYRVQPELGFGPQAREAGFVTGNGVNLYTTFLRRRGFPLTFKYKNISREQFTYGSLQELSGLRSFTRERGFNVGWQMLLPGLPRASFHYDRDSTLLDPQNPLTPRAELGTRQYGAEIKDERWGWRLGGVVLWRSSEDEYSSPFEPDLITVGTRRKSSDHRFSAQRSLGVRRNLNFMGGWRKGRSTFNGRPLDQNTRYVNAHLNYAFTERWESRLRAGYTSSRYGIFREQLLGSLAGEDAFGTEDLGTLEFLPFSSDLTALNFSGSIRYKLSRQWSFFGGMNQGTARRLDDIGESSKATSTIGRSGLNFFRDFSWATVTGDYTLEAGRLNFLESASTRGHSFSLRARRGTLEKLELSGTVSAGLRQVRGIPSYESSNQAVDFSLGRRIRGLTLRGHAGVRHDSLRNSYEYSNDAMSYGLSVQHQLFGGAYSRSANDGISLLPEFSSVAGNEDLGLFPLRSVLTFSYAHTFHGWLNFSRNCSVRMRSTTGGNDLERQFRHRYEDVTISVKYRFRLLSLEAGYNRYDISFVQTLDNTRKRFFVRIIRPFDVF